MKYLVILPAMVEHVAKPCLESIDPTVRENLLLIDNSKDGFEGSYGVETLRFPENYGVARSWNLGARRVLEQKLDYLIILSTAIVFQEGMLDFLELMNSELEPTGYQQYGVESQFSFHLVAIGRKTFEKVGLFDENFYPSYMEETDMLRRMELAGIYSIMDGSKRFPLVNVSAWRRGLALSIKRGGLFVNFLGLQDYWREKWGVVAEYENQAQRDAMYNHPFNDPTKPLSYWPERSIEELKQRYELP